MEKNYQTKLVYTNPLSSPQDIKDFVLEGEAEIYFVKNRMRMENRLDPEVVGEQKGNYVFWCPVDFPENLRITWEFKPLKEPGLAMMFFCAKGCNGEDIFDEQLAKRFGLYRQYNRSDINVYHISYFRRRLEDEIDFHTCNLRKSSGAHLVALGADPIPSLEDIHKPLKLRIDKYKNTIAFYIYNPYLEMDQLIFKWHDDASLGPVLKGGKIGFRQMAPFIGEYANLNVYELMEVTNHE